MSLFFFTPSVPLFSTQKINTTARNQIGPPRPFIALKRKTTPGFIFLETFSGKCDLPLENLNLFQMIIKELRFYVTLRVHHSIIY